MAPVSLAVRIRRTGFSAARRILSAALIGSIRLPATAFTASGVPGVAALALVPTTGCAIPVIASVLLLGWLCIWLLGFNDRRLLTEQGFHDAAQQAFLLFSG
jgi:hypothetical protein